MSGAASAIADAGPKPDTRDSEMSRATFTPPWRTPLGARKSGNYLWPPRDAADHRPARAVSPTNLSRRRCVMYCAYLRAHAHVIGTDVGHLS